MRFNLCYSLSHVCASDPSGSDTCICQKGVKKIRFNKKLEHSKSNGSQTPLKRKQERIRSRLGLELVRRWLHGLNDNVPCTPATVARPYTETHSWMATPCRCNQ